MVAVSLAVLYLHCLASLGALMVYWRSYIACHDPRHPNSSYGLLDGSRVHGSMGYGLYAARKLVIAGYEPRVQGAPTYVVIDRKTGSLIIDANMPNIYIVMHLHTRRYLGLVPAHLQTTSDCRYHNYLIDIFGRSALLNFLVSTWPHEICPDEIRRLKET